MTPFSARIVGYCVAGAIAALVIGYGMAQVDSILGRQDAATTAQSIAQLRRHPALERYRAKLYAIEQAKMQDVTRERGIADSLRHELATGRRTDTVRVVGEIAHHDSSATQGCSVVVLACEQRAASAEAEANDLHRQLAAQVQVRDHRCGVDVGIGASAGLAGSAAGLTILAGCRVLRIPLLP